MEKGLDGMECERVSGVRFYLGDVERRIEEERRFIKMASGKKALKLLFTILDRVQCGG